MKGRRTEASAQRSRRSSGGSACAEKSASAGARGDWGKRGAIRASGSGGLVCPSKGQRRCKRASLPRRERAGMPHAVQRTRE